MAEVKQLQILASQLHFDSDNPRHDRIETEPEIISRLYAREKVLALAKDVAKWGVSPLDRMAVIPHETMRERFVVVEGNRRLCALKLLRDPGKAPNAKSRVAFEALKDSSSSLPTKIDVVVFPDRKAARHWLELRHAGPQQGRSTVGWSPSQKTRFNAQGAGSDPNAQALALIDYAKDAKLLPEDDCERLALTTITRYLSTPVFRNTLGLVTGNDLSINVDQTEFDDVVSRFLRDALPLPGNGKAAVGSRSDSAQRVAYAHQLEREGVAPTTRLATPIVPVPKGKASKRKKRNSRHPDNRPHIVPSDIRINANDPFLRRLFEELRTLDADAFSFAAGYLLRAFVERTIHIYAGKRGLGLEGELHLVIARCVPKLEADGATEKLLKTLRTMSSDKDHRLSPHTLGAWVHGSVVPTGAEVKRRWESLQDVLCFIIEKSVVAPLANSASSL